jgi:hypothetical protein
MMKDILRAGSLTCIVAVLFTMNALAQTVLFYDNFNQTPVNPIVNSGDPAVDYTVWTTVSNLDDGGGTALIEEYAPGDGMIKLLARNNANTQTGNRTEVSAPLSGFHAALNPVLSANTEILEWVFTAKQNRNSSGGTTGFSGTNTGMAVILASDSSVWATDQGSNASGYAITFLKPEGNMYCVSLSRFDGGLSNYTVIAGNKAEDVFSDLRTWVTVKVTYQPSTNEWRLFFRDEKSTVNKGNIYNSAGMKLIDIVVDDTFTDLEMSHFGFALNTPAPGASGADWNAFWVDDFAVTLDDGVIQQYALNTEVSGIGGVILADPDQQDYPSGTQVQLTAVADSGFVFKNWSGDVTSIQNPLMVIIYSNLNITANFVPIPEEPNEKQKLIHYDEVFLEAVKKEIGFGNSFFVNAYNTLISNANKELNKAANPVTNKTVVPPSGIMNDYLSLAPYWWPNPDTEDGLPWVNRDGEVNPLTRGDNTDQVRLSNFLNAIELLSLAYYFSDDIKYANKAIELLNIWLVESETRVNPHANFAQGIPGLNTGRQIGIIEFSSVYTIIAAMQIMENKGVVPIATKTGVKDWLSEWSVWLRTSPFGVQESNMGNNHGTKYDFQVLGLLLYEGETTDAVKLVNDFKTKRIGSQIQPNGSQPAELSRTKSVNYSTMNLWGMTQVAQMGWQVGVDLWSFETSDGRSIRRAYEFLLPYVLGEETWTWQQITNGGAINALNTLTKPIFSKGSTIFREDIISQSQNSGNSLSYLDKLLYPPRERLFIEEVDNAYLFINTNPNGGTVLKNPDLINYEIGQEVVLTAEASPGYIFVNWTGDYNGTENPLTLTMDSTMRITANFLATYTVSISENIVNGTIEISPEKSYYFAGETVTFTPHPDPGYQFESWFAEAGISGSSVPLVITINRDIELFANFSLVTYELFTSANNGTISRNPHSLVYVPGTEVELTATPNEGYQFTSWSGSVTSIENPLTITMDSITYITANFDLISGLGPQSDFLINVYPNPAQDFFNVDINQYAIYSVYSLSGIKLLHGEASGSFRLDMKGNGKGIYILMIRTSDKLTVKSIILN